VFVTDTLYFICRDFCVVIKERCSNRVKGNVEQLIGITKRLSLLYNGYRVVPRGKERPGHDADPSPPSSAVVKKE